MNRSISLLLLGIMLAGCNAGQAPKTSPTIPPIATEIPCPGVEPRGISAGSQAYVTLTGPVFSASLFKEPDAPVQSSSAVHHIRVDVKDGPRCSSASAWWLVILPDGSQGWLQIGSSLEANGVKYGAALEPYVDDAVQREVPDERKKEAQVRYITADIALGGADVLKYYQDTVAAKPDDPETETMRIALEILKETGDKSILANAAAFERKPLRGGTSVVDAGTEYVQPGLDILLTPCDKPDPLTVCSKMK
jgi:hypothetical protein